MLAEKWKAFILHYHLPQKRNFHIKSKQKLALFTFTYFKVNLIASFLLLLNKIINHSSKILNGNCFPFYCRNHKDFHMPIWIICSIKRKTILTLYQQKLIWLWYIILQKHLWFLESMMEQILGNVDLGD